MINMRTRRVALIHIKVIDAPDAPLGLMYIASLLKQHGFEVRIWDEFKTTGFVKEVIEFEPDIVGFTVMSTQVEFAKEMVEILKAKSKALIVLGGIHPSVLPEETLKYTKADVIGFGEGELTMLELAQKYPQDDWRTIKGICFLDDQGKLKSNCGREPIADLDILPNPDYTMIDASRTFIPPGTVRGHFLNATAHLATSRGCPSRCIFCNCPTLFGNKVRQRSASNVINEIKDIIKNYPVVEGIWFVDDTFTNRPAWVIEFCERFMHEKLNERLLWSCQTRVTHVKEDMMRKMKQAGCVQVEFGMESGNDRILKVLGKNTSVELIAKSTKICREIGLDVFGTFMLGNPTETVEEMEDTFAMAKRLKLSGARFFFATPFPGTVLYDMALKNKWLSNKYAFNEVLSLRQTNPKDTTDDPLMDCGVVPKETLKKLRGKFQNHFVLKNYFVYLKQWNLILAMCIALLRHFKLFLAGVYYSLKSRRIDTFIEHVILAWRIDKLGKRASINQRPVTVIH